MDFDGYDEEFESYSEFLERMGLEDSEKSFEMFVDNHIAYNNLNP
ncbi:MAG TPA: hypothetical protein VHQ70_04000 [Syntrophomonadaceae bacterium]|nr:hypothetical protein [Syntrophomonadaceae bacterium]